MSWVKPIHFSTQTKAWLQTAQAPQYVWDDLEQVAKHNDKCRAILGQQ